MYASIPRSNLVKSDHAMPLSIIILKKCALNGIDANIIGRLHFWDLQRLIISIEMDNAYRYLAELNQNNGAKRGVKITDVEGSRIKEIL